MTIAHSTFRRRLLAAAAACALLPGLAAAQAFPGKPITIIVPFAAGGPTDRVARDLAEAMRKPLGGVSVVIDNAAGAGSSIGTAKVARANPDGYTLLLN
uniref:tripartite tricarboxylate transporter substrate-binding protein n=1 Tax=Raoultella terrigena TaxID=577 RepID=UPI002167EF65